jgi:leucine dehydrogenase
VVNGGGVIYLDMAMRPGADAAAIAARVTQIGDVVATIFRDSAEKGVTTLQAAEQLAAARLDAV